MYWSLTKAYKFECCLRSSIESYAFRKDSSVLHFSQSRHFRLFLTFTVIAHFAEWLAL